MYFRDTKSCHRNGIRQKEEVRQDDHELLKEKVELQQELIRRQDELARQKRVQAEDEEKQVGAL